MGKGGGGGAVQCGGAAFDPINYLEKHDSRRSDEEGGVEGGGGGGRCHVMHDRESRVPDPHLGLLSGEGDG